MVDIIYRATRVNGNDKLTILRVRDGCEIRHEELCCVDVQW